MNWMDGAEQKQTVDGHNVGVDGVTRQSSARISYAYTK